MTHSVTQSPSLLRQSNWTHSDSGEWRNEISIQLSCLGHSLNHSAINQNTQTLLYSGALSPETFLLSTAALSAVKWLSSDVIPICLLIFYPTYQYTLKRPSYWVQDNRLVQHTCTRYSRHSHTHITQQYAHTLTASQMAHSTHIRDSHTQLVTYTQHE